MRKKKETNQRADSLNLQTKESLKDLNEPNLTKSLLKTVAIIILLLAALFFLVYMAVANLNWNISN